MYKRTPLAGAWLQKNWVIADQQDVSALRPILFAIAAGSLMLGAVGVLSPALSTLLWLPSGVLLACHPSSPIVRMISSALLRDGK